MANWQISHRNREISTTRTGSVLCGGREHCLSATSTRVQPAPGTHVMPRTAGTTRVSATAMMTNISVRSDRRWTSVDDQRQVEGFTQPATVGLDANEVDAWVRASGFEV